MASADSHELIVLLYEGCLEKLAEAKLAIFQKKNDKKHEAIQRAVDIISGLRASLNKNMDHELPYNLDRLYAYMQERLLQADINNDLLLIDEVLDLVTTIKTGWDSIAVDKS